MDSRFRPLDGESFSKRKAHQGWQDPAGGGFRPLDGESFSKLVMSYINIYISNSLVSVP